jgi:GT2 family glycosyltransferase
MTGNFSPHVSIIVMNWNNYADTIECIESIEKISYPKYTIILVDNGSTDNSEAILRERFPVIYLIQTGKNLGFT